MFYVLLFGDFYLFGLTCCGGVNLIVCCYLLLCFADFGVLIFGFVFICFVCMLCFGVLCLVLVVGCWFRCLRLAITFTSLLCDLYFVVVCLL